MSRFLVKDYEKMREGETEEMRSRDPFVSQSRSAVNGSPSADKNEKPGLGSRNIEIPYTGP